MIEIIDILEKHNTLITINVLALGFASRAASSMTATFTCYDYHYATQTSAAGMGSRR